MAQDRVERLIDTYFNRPRNEYLTVLSSIKRQGGLREEEIRSIQERLPDVHSSAIIRQVAAVGAQAWLR